MTMTSLESERTLGGKVTGLRMTLDPRDPKWELPPVGSGVPLALIGWTTRVESVDAGVPPLAAEIIVRALTRRCRVTFPHPDGRLAERKADWQRTAAGWIRLLDPPRSVALRRRPAVPLLSTAQPESAARLFDAPDFPWVMKSQVAILSDLDAPPPAVSYQTVEALLDREPLDTRSLAAEARVRGILSPAVDGDFAALIVFNPDLSRQILDALADECASAGVSWEVVTELAFGR
jgi:hypothetical protein